MSRHGGRKKRMGLRSLLDLYGGNIVVVPPNCETMLGAFFADHYVAGKYGHCFDVWCVYPAAIVCGTRVPAELAATPPELLEKHRKLISGAVRADLVHGTGTRFFALEHFVDEVLAARAEGAGHPLPPPPRG